MRAIAVVAQDARADTIVHALRSAGFEDSVASDARSLTARRNGDFDLLVLDPAVTGTLGAPLLDQLRDEQPALPIILLASDDETTREVVARVREHFTPADHSPDGDGVATDEVRLDAQGRRAFVGEREVTLSPREFALASTLLRHRGQTLSREQLLEHVWGSDAGLRSNIVDVYVGYLRRKLGSDVVTTVRGLGYRVG
ncbi:winged helix-turn-helix transcriptional regulator [Aeromicrobium duanguangcaii]|uniref:winged helix-turn-helix transcriptional regulator n=1 Tax=Aeromicrobium duanguangcaii TaxID=2968086 RepID=UPI002017B75A|nr:response regulator transcription factor [Aeromicrobium duanguangcaii]MCL3837445.1 response regulator transcription factor [Aeromicrobium duanguangcaii]